MFGVDEDVIIDGDKLPAPSFVLVRSRSRSRLPKFGLAICNGSVGFDEDSVMIRDAVAAVVDDDAGGCASGAFFDAGVRGGACAPGAPCPSCFSNSCAHGCELFRCD